MMLRKMPLTTIAATTRSGSAKKGLVLLLSPSFWLLLFACDWKSFESESGRARIWYGPSLVLRWLKFRKHSAFGVHVLRRWSRFVFYSSQATARTTICAAAVIVRYAAPMRCARALGGPMAEHEPIPPRGTSALARKS